MPFVTIRGRKVEYEMEGSGETVVLSSPTWWPLNPWRISGIPQLSGRYRVLAFNHRGIGQSESGSEEYDVDLLTQDMLELMSALAIESAHIVGFAIGSAVALQSARTAPERVKSLVLSATGAGSPGRDPEQMLQPVRKRLAEKGYRDYVRSRALGDDLAFDPEWLRDHQAEAIRLADAMWANAGSEEEFLKHALVRRTYDVSEGLDEIHQPALVLVGADDHAERGQSTPVTVAKSLAEGLPEGRLIMQPGTRHMLFWQEPDECWSLISDFIEGQRGPTD